MARELSFILIFILIVIFVTSCNNLDIEPSNIEKTCPAGTYLLQDKSCGQCLENIHCIQKYGASYTCYKGSCAPPMELLTAECSEDGCLANLSEKPSCMELVDGTNNADENIINIVFVGHFYSNINDFKATAKKFVDYNGEGYELQFYDIASEENRIFGFLGTEPYKSNKNLFNFWYVDKIFSSQKSEEYCPSHFTDFEEICNFKNKYTFTLCNYLTQIAGVASNDIGISVVNEKGDFDFGKIGLINHELGGHAIGDLSDTSYPSLYGLSYKPECAANITEARLWWGDMIGNGCGNDGIVDCTEECVEKGGCSLMDYNTEVQFIAVKPEDCFEGGAFIAGCSLSLNRVIRQEDGKVISQPFSFKAMSKANCESSEDNCIYWDSGELYCFDKKTGFKEPCRGIVTILSYPHLETMYGCKYRPHLDSIMRDSAATLFGPVAERQICNRLKEITGKAGGYCTLKYRAKE